MIKIINVTKLYKNGGKGIKNISYTFENKGFYGIYGTSGSGKTTLLNCIGNIDEIDEERILLNNKDINEISNYKKNIVGYIFQDFKLIDDLSLIDNIRIDPNYSSADDDIIEKYLNDFNLTDFKNRPVKFLSGGQKQRVSIIRAIFKQPLIIIADEPTGNLDKKNTQFVFEFLKEQSKNKLVIVVSHDFDLLKKYSDKLIRVVDGEIENSDDNCMLESLVNYPENSKMDSQHKLYLFKRTIKKLLRLKGSNAIYCFAFAVMSIFLYFSTFDNSNFMHYELKRNNEPVVSLGISKSYYENNVLKGNEWFEKGIDFENIYDNYNDAYKAYEVATNINGSEINLYYVDKSNVSFEVKGRMPINDYEVCVSSFVLENFTDGRSIYLNNNKYEIVGTYCFGKNINYNQMNFSSSFQIITNNINRFKNNYIKCGPITNSNNQKSKFHFDDTLLYRESYLTSIKYGASIANKYDVCVSTKIANLISNPISLVGSNITYNKEIDLNYGIEYNDVFNIYDYVPYLHVVGIFESEELACYISNELYDDVYNQYDLLYAPGKTYVTSSYNNIKRALEDGYWLNTMINYTSTIGTFHYVNIFGGYFVVIASIVFLICFSAKEVDILYNKYRKEYGLYLMLGYDKKHIINVINKAYIVKLLMMISFSILIHTILTVILNLYFTNILKLSSLIWFVRFSPYTIVVYILVVGLTYLISTIKTGKLTNNSVVNWINN